MIDLILKFKSYIPSRRIPIPKHAQRNKCKCKQSTVEQREKQFHRKLDISGCKISVKENLKLNK